MVNDRGIPNKAGKEMTGKREKAPAMLLNETGHPLDPYEGLTPLEIKRLEFPKWGHQIVGAFLMCVTIFGFIENSLVMFIFFRNKTLLSPTNIFILGVAFGDLGMACLGNPLAFTSALNGGWFAGEFFCYWEGFIVYFLGLSQMYLIMAVSVDRYIVIAKPLLSSKITKKVAVISMAVCFVVSLLWALMPFLGFSSYGLEAPGVFCGLHWEDQSFNNTSFIIAIFILCFFVPLGVMIYSYYHVFMTVRTVNKNMVWDMNSRMARKNLKLEKRMLKTCVIMCGVFFAVWTPYAVVSMIQAFGDPDSIPLFVMELPSAAAKSQMVWNPIIYVATNKKFRIAFYEALPCGSIRDRLIHREEENDSNMSNVGDKTAAASSYAQTKIINRTTNPTAAKAAKTNQVAPTPEPGPSKMEC
ncbi:visual pigment-like receptor peropsin [Mya arenaria]|uniref:visual pigment-like receptor peropsin n=1 Tax=Mya arenaria TaxID=6604 RepID=UPI0022E92FE1|nr:visual pigment-like receptor peropsin [Mya arenaria]